MCFMIVQWRDFSCEVAAVVVARSIFIDKKFAVFLTTLFMSEMRCLKGK